MAQPRRRDSRSSACTLRLVDGFQIDPVRFAALLGLAEMTPRDLAEQVRCHPNHLRKFLAASTDGRAAMEPSRELADAMVRVLSTRLDDTVGLDAIANRVPSRWRTAS